MASTSTHGATEQDLEEDLSVNQLLQRAFALADQAFTGNSADDEVQLRTQTAISYLTRASSLAESLGIISLNEALDDINTRDLRALLIPSLLGELTMRLRTNGPMERRKTVEQARIYSCRFLSTLDTFSVVRGDDRNVIVAASSQASTSGGQDAARRREAKIAQFRLEKDIKGKLDEYRNRVRSSSKAPMPSDDRTPSDPYYDLLLVPRKRMAGGVNDSSSASDEESDKPTASTSASFAQTSLRTLRGYLLALLTLHYLRAAGSLNSLEMELELLRNMPSEDELSRQREAARQAEERERRRTGEDEGTWRLDGRGAGGVTGGPLLDPKGKPLRPFTITASGSPTTGLPSSSRVATTNLPMTNLERRAQIRAGVFQPSHRLPTMSIDEYLEEERKRGNIIEGGGPASAERPTPREQRALDAEQDGTIAAEEASEAARKEAIEWDAFTEANPRGMGNTMNRG